MKLNSFTVCVCVFAKVILSWKTWNFDRKTEEWTWEVQPALKCQWIHWALYIKAAHASSFSGFHSSIHVNWLFTPEALTLKKMGLPGLLFVASGSGETMFVVCSWLGSDVLTQFSGSLHTVNRWWSWWKWWWWWWWWWWRWSWWWWRLMNVLWMLLAGVATSENLSTLKRRVFDYFSIRL